MATNRGRFQAQGGGIEKSEPWATNNTIYKQNGIALINNLEIQLTPAELNARNIAIQKARNFVNACPSDGVPPVKKSYSNNLQNRSIRIDVEVNAGIAFVNNLNN